MSWRCWAAAAALASLSACSTPPRAGAWASAWADTIDQLAPTQVLLLGEQHDASEHQQLHARIVGRLAEQGRLAALVIEMAPAGGHTEGLNAQASEAEVKAALRWEEAAWPWSAYGPVVMAAVRARVPVRGGNLPLAQLRGQMADRTLEARLSPEALGRQQALIREGHCGLLPDSQIAPMARMQIARDLSMATAIAEALPQAWPGQVM